jgi:hypothetical protein
VLALAQDPYYYFCKDNAIHFNSTLDGATACTAEAVFFYYGGVVNGVAWMALAIDLFMKICLGIQNTETYFWYHFLYIYIFPAIATIAIVSTGTEFGYLEASSAICAISSNGDYDIYFFYIPLFFFNVVGLVCGKYH